MSEDALDPTRDDPRADRRARQQERTRRDILEAAMRAFAAQGFQQTRMSDIAEAAGFTAASLYTYFRSKRDIVLGCEALLTDEMRAAFGPVPASPEPNRAAFLEAFRARVDGFVAWADRRKDGIALFWRLRWTGDPDATATDQEELVARATSLIGHVAAVLSGLGIERHSWLTAEEAASVLLGTIESALVRTMIGCGGAGAIDAARLCRIVLHGIMVDGDAGGLSASLAERGTTGREGS